MGLRSAAPAPPVPASEPPKRPCRTGFQMAPWPLGHQNLEDCDQPLLPAAPREQGLLKQPERVLAPAEPSVFPQSCTMCSWFPWRRRSDRSKKCPPRRSCSTGSPSPERPSPSSRGATASVGERAGGGATCRLVDEAGSLSPPRPPHLCEVRDAPSPPHHRHRRRVGPVANVLPRREGPPPRVPVAGPSSQDELQHLSWQPMMPPILS